MNSTEFVDVSKNLIGRTVFLFDSQFIYFIFILGTPHTNGTCYHGYTKDLFLGIVTNTLNIMFIVHTLLLLPFVYDKLIMFST